MKSKLTLLLLLFFVSIGANAQAVPNPTFTIKGVLIDSLTQESEPYATLRVVAKKAPAKPVKMAVTDAQGKFQEKFATAPGTYVITLSSVGKTTVEKEFELKSGTPIVDLGTLYTAEATNELKGIEVVAQKPLVKIDVDKIEYNIADDPDSKTNNILEMLRKVPMVTVDGEDNVQVNGSSSFKIHVNGKPNNMMSNNPKEVLKSMPANTIKYIEVITSPGAKYDAEGVGGILNIVTVGSGFEGYTATFNGRVNDRGVGGGVYATIKKDKLTLTGNFNYMKNNGKDSYSDSEREYYESIDQKYLDSKATMSDKYNFQYGDLEASYEIDTLRLITLSAGLWGGSSNNGRVESTQMFNANRDVTAYSYNMNSPGNGNWYSIRGSLDYQRTSKRNKARMWTLSYKIDTRPEDSENQTRYTDLVGEIPEDLHLRDANTDGKTNTTEQTFQIDYTTPIGKLHTIETGLKYILRNNTSENDYYTALPGSDKYVLDEDHSSHYKNMNNIMAAYAGYTLKYKAFSFKPGLRYEYTFQDVKFHLGPGEDFDTHFSNLVPSVTLGLKVGKSQNLTAGYNMRISRPGIWYLNPYFDDRNPMAISQGNPLLETEKGHGLNLRFSSFTSKFNLNLTLRHSFTNNSIERVSVLVDDNTVIDGHQVAKGAIYTTYENMGKNKQTGLSTYVNWNASSKTRIYMNGSCDYIDIKSPLQELHNFGWRASVYGGIQHTLPWKLRASLNTGGSTPYITLQGKGSGYFYYGLGLNRSFLKEDRLTISLNASNIFNKYDTYSRVTEGPKFRVETNSKYRAQYYGLNISYRIGTLKASVKKVARTISNDDVKSGGDSNGGGQ